MTVTIKQADISPANFPKADTYPRTINLIGGARTARTWFKKFLRLWPEFKACPTFWVLMDGQLQFRCPGGCVTLAQSFLFGDAKSISPGSTVRIELA